MTAVGVLDTLAAHRETPPSSLTAVGILDTLAGSRNPPSRDQLHFEIQGQRRGKLCWSILAPRMSVSVIADVEPDLVDSIHLEDPGGHFQAVTLRFPLAAAAREVSLRVAGWRGDEREAIRTFALEGLTLVGGESIRVQVSDGGRELLVDNRGAAKTFELRLLAGVNAAVVAARPSVVLDAASVVRLTPSDWSPTAATTAPIRRDVLDQSWGQVVSSSVV